MTRDTRQAESAVPKLMLFVTGDAPRSRRARANLDDALKALELDHVEPLVVDLLEHPDQTITYSVYATPALVITEEDSEMSVLYGALSDQQKLHRFLGELANC